MDIIATDLKWKNSDSACGVQIPLERHAHSANGGMRIPDYSA